MHSCPRDQVSLTAHAVQGLNLRCCQKCAGLWLPSAAVATTVGQIRRPALPTGYSPPLRLQCPDDGSALMAVYHRGVEIDLCTVCGGVWLDAGELERILKKKRAYGAADALGDVATSPDAISAAPDIAEAICNAAGTVDAGELVDGISAAGEAAVEAVGTILQFIAEALSGL